MERLLAFLTFLRILLPILALFELISALLGANLGKLGPILGPTWANLGPTGANLGQLGANFGPTWANLGQLGANLEPSWANLGPTWRQLGPTWGQHGTKKRSRTLRGPFWEVFGTIWGTIWGDFWEYFGTVLLTIGDKRFQHYFHLAYNRRKASFPFSLFPFHAKPGLTRPLNDPTWANFGPTWANLGQLGPT